MSKPKTIRVDPDKITKIVDSAGLNLDQASKKMGASHSYLDKAVQRKRMSRMYLTAFCRTFNVQENDIRQKRECRSGGEVRINSELCKELIRQNGYNQHSASVAIGYSESSLSAALSIGALNSEGVKALADLLNVPWESLLKGHQESIEDNYRESEGNFNKEFCKCLYNLATSAEAALTGFRQDLLELIGEKSNGQT